LTVCSATFAILSGFQLQDKYQGNSVNFNNGFARQMIPRRCHTSALLGFICCAAQSAIAQSVFINEIHYDNTGADTGEAIEIAGPAGTNLAGWTVALYNGSASQLNVYGTIALSGVIPNQDSGFGVLSFSQAGIQNGSPDGMALVDSASTVIQFLSYEGSFTAGSGPASGATSTDIGVAEASSAAVGDSLQLVGSGTSYGDFAWATSTPNTFGSVNTSQSFGGGGGGPGAGVIINEADADTAGTDILEFVELFDGGAGNTALDGLVVVFYNGNGDVSYNAFDLDGFSTDADGYFVLGNAGVVPTPSIIFGSNGLQNGADAVALYAGDAASFPDGTAVTTTDLRDALVYDTSDADDAGLLALLNAGQPQVNENGAGNKDGHSNQRCPNGSGGARNTSNYAQFAPTAGSANVCVAPAAFLKIHEVQGSGPASPEVGNTVIIEGIVVGDFQDGASGTHGDLNGFFVQEEDGDADADPQTSEGIFVFDGSSPAVDVMDGDLVRVEGAVSEFGGLTEISSFTGVTVMSSGNPLPAASSLSLPVASLNDHEAFEGMYVTFPQALVISDYFNFDRFNEILLTSERHLTPTAEFEPGPAAVAAANAFPLDTITLDDGRTISNPDPAIHPNGMDFDLTNLFRGGDTLQNVTGVLSYAFGQYRIQPTQGADHFNDNPRTAEPDPVGGSSRIVSFNALNYFSTIDDGVNDICGPSQIFECRGADNADEFARQRAKTIAALTTIDADVVGLLEIENNINDDALIDLVSGLNDASGPGTYDYVSTGTIGTDAIKVALLYKPASVSPVGAHAILDSSVDGRFIDTKNRPTLAQTFMNNSTGGVFTVAVNHLKSKGSPCDDVSDPDTGDGSGNCNLTRAAAAEALVDWLAGDPTGSGDDDFIIIGDLNSYDKEDPVDAILAGGYTDLIHVFRGEDAYSFVFGGQTGYLDYALAGEDLLDEVTGATEWHINADEPDLIDYDTSFKQPNQQAIYAPDAYRSSDHDPVIVGLDTCDEIPPTIDEISVTPNVLWPANHKYVDVTATVSVSDNFDPDVIVTLVSATSNEPDNGEGDGNTENDIVVVDDMQFMLRAERSGNGTGRVYTLTYLATDACGNSATDAATVTVPHSKGD
jgi:predicted extracellular nuclease